ncbi:CoF synthetase [Demequina sp. SYSU T00192]|uniref:CoF synthetase n=1 Tax=Demequina litoralis TaxID=3051660 RepID=A0ABT8GCI1_9MICO|nr:CoF synthetase [Demequina sp. SYSU T00192]MDN4476855.1 CoF synthetase [Demequina sp. SYSU T00192]
MRGLLKYPAFAGIAALDAVIRVLARKPTTHRLLLGPGIEPLRWWLGRARAWRTFHVASRRVPAYRAFLAEAGHGPDLAKGGSLADALGALPEMDKAGYIARWTVVERSLDGRLPRRGVVVDESSGSSGVPTSWVRGPDERLATRQLLQMGYSRTSRTLTKQPFVLNCFSLGAWATGMNISASLTEITMMKSIGPDRDKVVQTMREFGPGFTYVILGYPPFLKALFEDDRLDWSGYDIVTAFGGEGISERMRAIIGKNAAAVFGSYGASDLEINIAIETDFSVQLRQAIAASPELAARITKRDEYGVLPMVFQFNPFDYLMESNEAGELLVTITRGSNINPRIRYNIHDRGHTLRLRDLDPVLDELGLSEVTRARITDLPLLFLYGRSDMSVDFNGAVVAPDTVRDAIYDAPGLADAIENHRLVSYEDARGDRQLHIALQRIERGPEVDEAAVGALLFAAMRRANGDFSNAIRTSPDGTLPTIAVYPYRTGPFANDGAKLKNEYVWMLDTGEHEAWGLRAGFTAPRHVAATRGTAAG